MSPTGDLIIAATLFGVFGGTLVVCGCAVLTRIACLMCEEGGGGGGGDGVGVLVVKPARIEGV